ncbi:MAG: peptide-methionine (S)-S-oxide reductase MsrA [Anaerolineae bacterium]|nr:peptide-methionine (S)-S-oxide reductase MsrA [Anaerolineae bacterium]MDQ7037182.1 peptide-methionine (S)-S-oxide reductase MsrA [Anaerolineae bacterium]
MATEIATLGGGCFWCIEAVYNQLKGVNSALSGYSGGHVGNPTYGEVCNKTTGHAEVVQVEFDNEVISFADILDIFFTIHDPTTLNRQGNDVGPQYRSAIYYHSDEQKRIADEKIKEFNNTVWSDSIVTEVTAFDKFYVAEDVHQAYFANNPNQPYCQVVVAPKVAKFRKKFFNQLKAEAV